MPVIYMQSTIDNFVNKGRINEVIGNPEIIELTDDKDNIITKYYKFE